MPKRQYNNVELAAAQAADDINIILHAHTHVRVLSEDQLKGLNEVLEEILTTLRKGLNSAGIYSR